MAVVEWLTLMWSEFFDLFYFNNNIIYKIVMFILLTTLWTFVMLLNFIVIDSFYRSVKESSETGESSRNFEVA
jgi:uncharacterized membrane protein